MAVLLPRGAFLTEDRPIFTQETAEPLGVSPPKAVDSFLIESGPFRVPIESGPCRISWPATPSGSGRRGTGNAASTGVEKTRIASPFPHDPPDGSELASGPPGAPP